MYFMTTVHDGSQYTIRDRKRPSETSSSAKTSRLPFKGESHAMLPIPTMIDEYNHHMGFVNQGDQLHSYNSMTRIIRKGWKALYDLLLGISVVNVYKLSFHSIVDKKQKFNNQGDF